MNAALQIMSIIAMCIVIVLFVWGFVLFYRYTEDVRKQNMMLFSILDKLKEDKKNISKID